MQTWSLSRLSSGISCIRVQAVEARVVDEGGVDRVGKIIVQGTLARLAGITRECVLSSPITCHIIIVVMSLQGNMGLQAGIHKYITRHQHL